MPEITTWTRNKWVQCNRLRIRACQLDTMIANSKTVSDKFCEMSHIKGQYRGEIFTSKARQALNCIDYGLAASIDRELKLGVVFNKD